MVDVVVTLRERARDELAGAALRAEDGHLAVVGNLVKDVLVDVVLEELEVRDVDRRDVFTVDVPLFVVAGHSCVEERDVLAGVDAIFERFRVDGFHVGVWSREVVGVHIVQSILLGGRTKAFA